MDASEASTHRKSPKRRGRKSTVLARFKEAFSDVLTDLEDDGVACDVCGRSDSWDEDVILLCDGCDAAAHMRCYGISQEDADADQFFCAFCKRLREDPTTCGQRECVVCPRKNGMMVPTEDGRWTHVMCAVWVPEMMVDVTKKRGSGIANIQPARFTAACQICKEEGIGAIVQCAAPKCFATFHPICGRLMGWGLDLVIQLGAEGTEADEGGEGDYKAYCHRHASLVYAPHTAAAAAAAEEIFIPLEHRSTAKKHALLRVSHLLRRNRTICNEVHKLHQEGTPWALLTSERLLFECHKNLAAVSREWATLQRTQPPKVTAIPDLIGQEDDGEQRDGEGESDEAVDERGTGDMVADMDEVTVANGTRKAVIDKATKSIAP